LAVHFVVAWIFQYRPKEYDLAEGTRDAITDWWAMNQGRAKVAIGDRVYFLRSGPAAAITAVGEITRTVYERQTGRGDTAVDVKFRWFVSPELSRRAMSSDASLRAVHVLTKGRQGTNFGISVEQCAALDSLLSERLSEAAPGRAPKSPALLSRKDTALDRSLEAIKTDGGRVTAVQVQFYRQTEDDPDYLDSRLKDGTIELIGRGKRSGGDQQRTHGNRALALAVEDRDQTAFPVYEKVAPRTYRYLGDYVRDIDAICRAQC
jgi:hypothetical protein